MDVCKMEFPFGLPLFSLETCLYVSAFILGLFLLSPLISYVDRCISKTYIVMDVCKMEFPFGLPLFSLETCLYVSAFILGLFLLSPLISYVDRCISKTYIVMDVCKMEIPFGLVRFLSSTILTRDLSVRLCVYTGIILAYSPDLLCG